MRNMGSAISNNTQNEKQSRGGEKKVMKKSLSVIVSSAMALSMFSSVAFGAKIDDFKDLKDLSAKDKAKFAAMIDANILHGLTSDYFGLYEATNRAQFARVAADVFKLKVDTSLEKSSFSDVSKEDPANGYALPYIEAAKDNGIAAGYEDGTYRPDKTLTKEELATLLVKGLGFKDEAEAATGSDPSVSDWAQGYVKVAVEKGIMNNDTNGMFNGQQLVNRYMLVTSTYPVFERTISKSLLKVPR
ncbi:S-layer homology domain-containing protein [Paenibacillus larvae]|nr:S-layer homology domain-containing protein [Paenibacillus larvae]MDT2256774.1 S-layer homology domain-containing protein [Paenibacillus larvae]